MDSRFIKVLIVAAVAIYVIAPDLVAGPVDDIIAVLLGAAAMRRQSEC